MNKKTAEALWAAIVEFGASKEGLGAEGNSGEFHDDDAERDLIAQLEKDKSSLCLQFQRATGWLPVENGDGWELRKEARP